LSGNGRPKEETSAAWIAQAALREAEMGFPGRAAERAKAALDRSTGREVRCISAYALARSGEAALAVQAAASNAP
jgi:hypothetical protein